MKIVAIARNTFREAVRNKILYSLVMFAIVMIFASLVLGEFTLGEEVRLTRDLGLYGVDMFGVLIAIFLGVNMLYKELALKTVYTILPKPIARYQFVLGKWLGLVTTLVLQVVVMGAVLQVALLIQGAGFESAVWKALLWSRR
jgi:ABC-type transport system involved in multi-copper enzyme maturation permease subunit